MDPVTHALFISLGLLALLYLVDNDSFTTHSVIQHFAVIALLVTGIAMTFTYIKRVLWP